jgi:hypothetical protein
MKDLQIQILSQIRSGNMLVLGLCSSAIPSWGFDFHLEVVNNINQTRYAMLLPPAGETHTHCIEIKSAGKNCRPLCRIES